MILKIRSPHGAFQCHNLLLLGALSLIVITHEARAGVYSDAVTATPGLQGYWRLGEASGSFSDSGPHGLSGAQMQAGGANAGMSRSVPGPQSGNGFAGFETNNAAIGVDRTDGGDWVQVDDDDRLDPRTGDWTAEAWFYNDGQNPAQYTWAILAKLESGNDGTVGLNGYSMQFDYWDQNNSVAAGYRRDGGAYVESYPAIPVSAPGWHHIVSVLHRNRTLAGPDYTASGVSVFIDGAFAGGWLATGLDGSPGFDINNNDALTIGAFTQAGNFGFRGSIDEVAVYNRALSPAEIAGHFAAAQVPEPATFMLALVCGAASISCARPGRRSRR